MTSGMSRALQPYLLPSVILIAVEFCVRLSSLSGESALIVVLPPPSIVAVRVVTELGQLQTLTNLSQTLITAFLGLGLGSVTALIAGFALGSTSTMSNLATPTIHFLRSLPVVLYVPITLVFVGADVSAAILLAALVSALYGVIPVLRAARTYDEEKRYFLRSRDLDGVKGTLRFVLPDLFGSLLLSLSIVTPLALAVVVVAEMLLPGLGGLGASIVRAREAGDYVGLWSLTAILGVSGYCFHRLILRTTRYGAPWLPSNGN